MKRASCGRIGRAISGLPVGIFAFLIALLPYASAASENQDSLKALSKSVTIPALVKSAVQRNPGLKAARLTWGAALAKVPQVRAWPDPMISYLHYGESVETRVGPQEHRWGITQNLPFPGTLSAAGKVALEKAKIAQVKHELALRDLIVDVKMSFHELAYLERAIVITGQNRKLMQQANTVANSLYAKEEATLNDVLKAQAQAAQLEYDLILLRELLAVEKAQLAALLNLPGNTAFGTTVVSAPKPLALSFEALEKRALAQRQELRIADGKVALTKQQVRLARFQNLPKFSLSAMKIETGDALNPYMDDSGKDAIMYGAGITIPWNFSKNKAVTREANLKHQAAVNMRLAEGNKTSAMLKRLYFRLQNSQRLLTLYEKSLIPQAKKAMSIAEKWDVDGRKDISGFLETQSVWLNFNLARLRAQTDYQQAVAAIERLVGGHLEPDAASKEGAGEKR